MFKSFIDDIGTLLTQPILNADAYKASHHLFEHPAFTSQYAYIEARKGGEFSEVQFFGLLYVLRYYMRQRVTMAMIDEAEQELTLMGIPFHREMWLRIVKKHKGKLPVRIKAIKEGTIVPAGTVLVTIESTDPECAGLAAYVETLLLRGVWFPTTIATRSMRWQRMVEHYLEVSGTPETSEFKIVDFGARGVSSTETAGIAGMAHLVNHQVTDNLMGVRFAKHAYTTSTPLAFTVPATEHSVTTSWGKEIKVPGGLDRDGEIEFYHNIIDVFGDKVNPLGGRYLVSVVIDTYDQDAAIEAWLSKDHSSGLRARLEASNICLVLRPDSGDPIINVVHVLDLANKFTGHTVNAKGYMLLPDFVRVIQGDGINEQSLRRILQRVIFHRWSIDNLVFGSGGGLLVHEVERDTHRFAMKASEVIIEGVIRAIQKTVKTDTTKASKKGRFSVYELPNGDAGVTIVTESYGFRGYDADLLRLVFLDGELVDPVIFDEVRETSRRYRKYPSPAERHAAIAHDLLDLRSLSIFLDPPDNSSYSLIRSNEQEDYPMGQATTNLSEYPAFFAKVRTEFADEPDIGVQLIDILSEFEAMGLPLSEAKARVIGVGDAARSAMA